MQAGSNVGERGSSPPGWYVFLQSPFAGRLQRRVNASRNRIRVGEMRKRCRRWDSDRHGVAPNGFCVRREPSMGVQLPAFVGVGHQFSVRRRPPSTSGLAKMVERLSPPDPLAQDSLELAQSRRARTALLWRLPRMEGADWSVP